MKALAVTAKQQMELINVAEPKIATPDEVIIKVSYCGICGSDLPRYFDGAVHSFPQILGHEFSGVVTETGAGVENVKPGDRVVIAPLIPCCSCEECISLLPPGMCSQYGFIGSRNPGAMAEFVKVPSKCVIKLPERLSLKKAALVEPFTVALHAIEQVSLKANETAMVLGCGSIGIALIKLLKVRGVCDIIAIDLNQDRLKNANSSGATITINPTIEDVDTILKNSNKPSIVFETAGSPVTQKDALRYVNKKGSIVYVGTSKKDIIFSPELFELIFRKEIVITGSMMSYSNPFPGYEWDVIINYLNQGLLDTSDFVTGTFKLEDKEKAFHELLNKPAHLKLLYEINPEK